MSFSLNFVSLSLNYLEVFTAQANPLGTIIHKPNTIGKGWQGVVENNAGDTI